ncbi:OsmC family protein [Nocardia spumae]|uniref:OsmC family protein n=1 Tax=Nocardia spumae TaxID=2887190 RepID=UPI001D14058F|nr:OsmC family protein [Nocardia spumae]
MSEQTAGNSAATAATAAATSTTDAAAKPARAPKPATDLWVERTGTRRYTGRSSRGAEVLIGSDGVEGVFTPGELLKIALAACTGMSSDFPLSNRLGETYDTTIRVSGDADRENEVYPELNEVVELDLSELDEAARQRLLVTVQRAIDKVCTVGRTLKAGSTVNLTFQIDS